MWDALSEQERVKRRDEKSREERNGSKDVFRKCTDGICCLKKL